MDNNNIENSVNNLFKEINYNIDKCPVDVINIAQKLGFVVGNAILNEEDDGFIIIEEGKNEIMGINTDKLIGVNSARSLEWKRFIIAHEIGHYILDYKQKNLKGLYAHRDHKKGHNVSENEIDFFAANLLMPRDSFTNKYNIIKQIFSDNTDIINALANTFIVTVNMAERRIKELNLS